jgi:hypothetical protein
VLAPDQGIGQDYWSKDTHEYKMNVAAHNTVSPNGKGAELNMPQNLKILYAEPGIIEGEEPEDELSPNHQFVDAVNHFKTKEIDAEQRRVLSIVRTSPHNGYFVDIFRSGVIEKYNQRGFKVGVFHINDNKVKYAIKKRPIKRVTDLTYENIRHISATTLIEVLERNFGGGWDSLSQSIQDIIESGFDISTTTLPKDRLHKPGGMYEKKINDGFEVLDWVREQPELRNLFIV